GRNSYVNRGTIDDETNGDLEQEITSAFGPFGEVYTQFKGKAKEAIAWLMKKKEGEVRDALHHHTIGDISAQ
ncbi:MAG: hypothetical protein ACI4B5_00385, partial [Bacteroidaceae bacterium]